MGNNQENLADLLLIKLKALYDVEDCLKGAWPLAQRRASNRTLKSILGSCSRQSLQNKKQIERVFRLYKKKPEKLSGEAVRGLVEDTKWVIENVKGREARDANLVAAVQYILHYQIAGYGSARAWAEMAGNLKAEALLRKPLQRAGELDSKLTAIAGSKLNPAAASSRD
jgi:ferritin-like metal-binding protein YciE